MSFKRHGFPNICSRLQVPAGPCPGLVTHFFKVSRSFSQFVLDDTPFAASANNSAGRDRTEEDDTCKLGNEFDRETVDYNNISILILNAYLQSNKDVPYWCGCFGCTCVML